MISIIIPAYNAQEFIGETIESVIDQTITDWELIIVDDGSTDNTGQIIKTFEENDSRIKYIYQENAGVSAARNKGIDNCSGEVVAFLDADDIWRKDNLEKKLNLLQNDNEISWVFSQLEYFSENSNSVEPLIDNVIQKNWLNSLLLWEGIVKTTPSNIVVKRNILQSRSIKFDTNLSTAADQDFCIQLAANFKASFIAEPLVKYRVLVNSMSRNIAVMEKDHIDVYIKAFKNGYFKNFWFKQKCFSKLFMILAGSWWSEGRNKMRGLLFICKALFYNPFSILTLIKKLK